MAEVVAQNQAKAKAAAASSDGRPHACRHCGDYACGTVCSVWGKPNTWGKSNGFDVNDI
jgi:Fe-S-cluster-containing hydrogenase component 2